MNKCSINDRVKSGDYPAISKGYLSTTIIYSIVFPLGIKFLATTVFPNLPSLLVTALGSAAKGFSVLGNAMISIQNSLTFGLTIAPVAAMPELVAASGVLVLLSTISAVLIEKTYRRFRPAIKSLFEVYPVLFSEKNPEPAEEDFTLSHSYGHSMSGLGTSEGSLSEPEVELDPNPNPNPNPVDQELVLADLDAVTEDTGQQFGASNGY